ncbi:hypothetical protein B0H19DRAFT_1264780 [Mycena capillaripes]|nr:hypothetical protein B0H19DRAFT_1264780 [Mycena capillaripes]
MSGNTGSSTSPPPHDAPLPVPPATSSAKRKYDALVADLGDAPPVGNGKRAKRDTMDTKGPLEKLLSMAKYLPRGVHPFYDIGLVMHVGSQSHWTVQVSTDPSITVTIPTEELQSQRGYNNAFDKLVAVAPESVEVLREAYKENTHWKALIHKFRKAAGDARQQDTSGLKHKTNCIPSDPTKSISPALSASESKSDRGVNHPMLRDTIIPWSLRLKIHAHAAVEDDEDVYEAPLTPEATTALEALLNGCKLTNGKPALTASNFPSCFYADGAYDPADPRHGLLRSPFLLRVARHIWTAPASAMDGASKLKKNCAARAHGKYIMTPEMLGYVRCQARTMLSTSAWTSKDGKYDYEKLFDNIVQLFEPNPDDLDDLGVFACGDSAASDDEDSDDDDSEMATIRARRAARSSTASSD